MPFHKSRLGSKVDAGHHAWTSSLSLPNSALPYFLAHKKIQALRTGIKQSFCPIPVLQDKKIHKELLNLVHILLWSQLYPGGRKSKGEEKVGWKLEVLLAPLRVRHDLSRCHRIRDIYRSLDEVLRSHAGLELTDLCSVPTSLCSPDEVQACLGVFLDIRFASMKPLLSLLCSSLLLALPCVPSPWPGCTSKAIGEFTDHQPL